LCTGLVGCVVAAKELFLFASAAATEQLQAVLFRQQRNRTTHTPYPTLLYPVIFAPVHEAALAAQPRYIPKRPLTGSRHEMVPSTSVCFRVSDISGYLGPFRGLRSDVFRRSFIKLSAYGIFNRRGQLSLARLRPGYCYLDAGLSYNDSVTPR
jgi:hypothetical protein